MLPVPKVKNVLKLFATIILAAQVFPKTTWAAVGAPQICNPSTTCTVGEFVYDDSYVLITDATCTLTSHDPSGVSYQDGVAMTPSDGWYYKSFTAPATTGLYRARVCCLVDGANMCLDKSFEVKESAAGESSDDIAEAVWGYSGRTLSSFGTLVADIWAATTRTLSSFGNLASDVWNNSSRTLTSEEISSSKKLATQTSVDDIKKTINETRNLVEELVNKPIIENVLEDDSQNVTTKLENTKSIAGQLFINTQYIVSKAYLVSTKWRKFSETELQANLDEMLSLVGDQAGTSTTSISGQVNYLINDWDFEVLTQIQSQSKVIRGNLASISRSIDTYGVKKLPEKDLRTLLSSLKNFEVLVGDSTNNASDVTLFGKIRQTQELATLLDKKDEEIGKVLNSWNKLPTEKKTTTVSDLRKGVLAVNVLPKIDEILFSLTQKELTDKELKNKVLSYQGIIATNRLYLSKKASKAFSNTWLEEGSIVFKTIITNPSTIIKQTVPLKYYLPSEVKEEDIIEKDEGLKVGFDPERNQYFIEGEFSLLAGETKTVGIRVNDIWKVSEEEIASLKKQATDLARPLEKTSFFAQGVTLSSDIEVSLNKIAALQSQAVTPEAKIRAYREAKIELDGAKSKIDKLKDLATEAGSAGSFFGFVGGSQTLAVWGLIIVIVAGFIWLSLSMKMIRGKRNSKKEKLTDSLIKTDSHKRKYLKLALPFLSAMIVSSVASSLATRSLVMESQKRVLGDQVSNQDNKEIINQEEPLTEEAPAKGGEDIVKIVVPESGRVNIRTGSSVTTEIVARLNETREAIRLSEENDWVEVILTKENLLGETTEGWVNKDFILDPKKADELDKAGEEITIVINDTPTGFLRVRQEPKGREIARVNPGESFKMLSQQDGCFEIELKDGSVGWISSEYSSVSD